MRAQSYTVMSYLVWAVFFAAALAVVYYIFSTTIKSSTPSSIPTILDTIRSAISAGETGIGGEVCTEVFPSGEIYITEDLIEKETGFEGRINFRCESVGNCEAEKDYIKVFGRRGRLCAELSNGTLYITWR